MMAPGEYTQYTIEYEIGGKRTPGAPPERGRRRALRIPASPQIGVVVGLAVAGETAGTIQLIEVVAQKGHGALNTLGSMGKAMKESCKAAYEYVSHRRKSLKIVSEFKDGYDLSILALQGAIPKEGRSSPQKFGVCDQEIVVGPHSPPSAKRCCSHRRDHAPRKHPRHRRLGAETCSRQGCRCPHRNSAQGERAGNPRVAPRCLSRDPGWHW